MTTGREALDGGRVLAHEHAANQGLFVGHLPRRRDQARLDDLQARVARARLRARPAGRRSPSGRTSSSSAAAIACSIVSRSLRCPLGPVRDRDEASRHGDPGELGEGIHRVLGELQRVDRGDDIEGAVRPGQVLGVTGPDIGAWRAAPSRVRPSRAPGRCRRPPHPNPPAMRRTHRHRSPRRARACPAPIPVAAMIAAVPDRRTSPTDPTRCRRRRTSDLPRPRPSAHGSAERLVQPAVYSRVTVAP